MSFPQEDIVILSVYAPNERSAKYVKEKLVGLKEEIDKNILIVGVFNTPLSTIDRQLYRNSSRI